MPSRQNISGRKGGFGRGILSKVYGAAQKQAAANRGAGAPPGTRKTTGMFGSKKQRLGITQEQADAGITSVDEGREAAGLPKRSLGERMGAKGGFSAAVRRGMAAKGGYAADKSAPGLDQLTGGQGIQATPAAPPPDITMNPMPPTGEVGINRPPPRYSHAPINRGMRRAGAERLASMGVTPGAPAPSPTASRGGVTERLAMNKPVLNPSAMTGGPTPAPVVSAPEVTENIAAPSPTAALAPGQGSVRSRGMHRSVPRRRAPEDRG